MARIPGALGSLFKISDDEAPGSEGAPVGGASDLNEYVARRSAAAAEGDESTTALPRGRRSKGEVSTRVRVQAPIANPVVAETLAEVASFTPPSRAQATMPSIVPMIPDPKPANESEPQNEPLPPAATRDVDVDAPVGRHFASPDNVDFADLRDENDESYLPRHLATLVDH